MENLKKIKFYLFLNIRVQTSCLLFSWSFFFLYCQQKLEGGKFVLLHLRYLFVPELLTVSEDNQEMNQWRLSIRMMKKLSKPKSTRFPDMLRFSASNAKSEKCSHSTRAWQVNITLQFQDVLGWDTLLMEIHWLTNSIGETALSSWNLLQSCMDLF